MRFSFSLIKKLNPALRSKKELIEKLNLHSFEASDLAGDGFDATIPPNRFSNAASHWGVAREISAILGSATKNWEADTENRKSGAKPPLSVEIKDKNLCPRYRAEYFENIKIKPSPRWLQKILIDCGLRPVSNVVDIMNYAMLETGQPLHAFDFDKIKDSRPGPARIVVRSAREGEKISALDNKNYVLDSNILVIADGVRPLAIAGIKGGKRAEVGSETRRIVVEAANFNSVAIYRASQQLNLITDASLRFSHNLSPALVPVGLNRAAALLREIIGAQAGAVVDVNFAKPAKTIIKMDLARLSKFIGIDFEAKAVMNILERLGFKIKVSASSANYYPPADFLVEVPALRDDILTFEDLAEEITRLYGYNRIRSAPPRVHLIPSGFEDQIVLKDKVRRVLAGFGLSEVYNYSFAAPSNEPQTELNGRRIKSDKNLNSIGNGSGLLAEIENPIAEDKKYLRPNLTLLLLKNVESNFRFFDEVKIFEIGKVFQIANQRQSNSRIFANKIREDLRLGIALASKNKEIFFELKGLLEKLFEKIGLTDYLMPEKARKHWDYLAPGSVLEIESAGLAIGYLGRAKAASGHIALAEIDLAKLLELVSEEHEYRPLSRYPSVVRDISFRTGQPAKIGDIIEAIQETDLKNIEDVDLVDEYKDSVTLRIIFQDEKRTLTDAEVNKKMEVISRLLKKRFKAEIR